MPEDAGEIAAANLAASGRFYTSLMRYARGRDFHYHSGCRPQLVDKRRSEYIGFGRGQIAV